MYARDLLVIALLSGSACLFAEEITVRHREGRIHGFLALRDADDQIIASGTSVQSSTGNRVTSELSFRFKDGSVHQETSVFSQNRTFRLLNYHLVQKGPAFKGPMDFAINTATG